MGIDRDDAHADARLLQSRTLEAIGQLTGGIAHDFNNLLTAVMGSLELIRDRSTDPRTTKLASTGLAAVSRGARLTAQLLAFARMQRLSIEPVDINASIEAMRTWLERLIGPTVRLRLSLDVRIGPAMADRSQLELAIAGIAANACEAMPDGGILTVETDEERMVNTGPCVVITIRDNGVGMSAEVAERAFEPFFTTKEPGKGSGLGLSEVYGIARQCGGAATIESAVGDGTAVRLLLPLAPPMAQPAA